MTHMRAQAVPGTITIGTHMLLFCGFPVCIVCVQEAARLRAERNTADTKAVKDVLGTAAKAAGLIAKKIVTE